MSNERAIHVTMNLRGRVAHCGTIRFDVAQGAGSFTYDDGYDGPALDPVHLNPTSKDSASDVKRFDLDASVSPDLLHRVFLDYLPGPWGLQVLTQEHPELAAMCAAEKLYWLGSRSVGSLSFHVLHPGNERPIHGAQRLEQIRRRSIRIHIGHLARIGDLNQEPGQGMTDRWVLDGLSAFGGARPKCTFQDRAGGQWIAKFNLPGDAYNHARVESALSTLAKRCAIRSIETRVVSTEAEAAPGAAAARGDILFVRRFDRKKEARIHKVSAFSLMHEDVKHHSGGDYRMLFDLLDRVCCDPAAERAELLRRLLFNIAVNNTDDHLKNFELVLEDCEANPSLEPQERPPANCYRLSPAFDVTVDPYPYARMTHVFGLDKPDLSRSTMDHIAKSLALDVEAVLSVRDAIVVEISRWREVFDNAGVEQRDIERLSRAFKPACTLAVSLAPRPVQAARDQRLRALSSARGQVRSVASKRAGP